MSLPAVLVIVILPSSKGWRRDSVTRRLNSGSSSKNKTPLLARETSPGIGILPPPAKAGADIVWCGARKGRVVMRETSFGKSPEIECTFVVSIDSSKVISGKMEGILFAIIDFPVPGGPINKMLCPPAAAIRNTSAQRLAAAV